MSSRRVVEAGVLGLLSEILRGTPKLSGALCVGRHTLFDLEFIDNDDREYAADAAAQVCWECPALRECGQWANAARLSGVVAGRDRGAA